MFIVLIQWVCESKVKKISWCTVSIPVAPDFFFNILMIIVKQYHTSILYCQNSRYNYFVVLGSLNDCLIDSFTEISLASDQAVVAGNLGEQGPSEFVETEDQCSLRKCGGKRI